MSDEQRDVDQAACQDADGLLDDVSDCLACVGVQDAVRLSARAYAIQPMLAQSDYVLMNAHYGMTVRTRVL